MPIPAPHRARVPARRPAPAPWTARGAPAHQQRPRPRRRPRAASCVPRATSSNRPTGPSAWSARTARLQDFVHHGVDAAPSADIVPSRPLRSVLDGPYDDPATHRSTAAAVHPRRRRLHSVPIRARDQVYGTLYLARPAEGHFGPEDEEVLAALAATAATAIANARLYEDAQRSRDWLHASGEIARALLADASDVRAARQRRRPRPAGGQRRLRSVDAADRGRTAAGDRPLRRRGTSLRRTHLRPGTIADRPRRSSPGRACSWAT